MSRAIRNPLRETTLPGVLLLGDAAVAFGGLVLGYWLRYRSPLGVLGIDVPDARFEFGPSVGAYAEGTLGQYLVVLPRDRLVAVRMRREPKNLALRNDPEQTFPDFVERVRGLVEGRNQ